MFSAAAKMLGVFYSPVGIEELSWLPEWLIVQLAVFEAILGMVLFFALSSSKMFYRFVGIFHAILAVVSGAYVLSGSTSCGCAGNLELHPAFFFLWDVIVVAASQVLVASKGRIVVSYLDGLMTKQLLVYVATFCTTAGLFAALCTIPFGRQLIGSQSTVDVVNFDRGRVIDFGILRDLGQVVREVGIRNSQSVPVVVKSGGSSCGCITLDEFPKTLQPQSITYLSVRVAPSLADGVQAKRVQYFLEEGGVIRFSVVFKVENK